MGPHNSTCEILHFDHVKVDRGSYFVDYQPPVAGGRFATLSLVYSERYDLDCVADALKSELAHWVTRYPVPTLAFAFDSAENIIRQDEETGDGFLAGWYAPGTTTLTYVWESEGLPAFVKDTTNLSDWRVIYKDIPFRTDSEVKAEAKRKWIKIRNQNFLIKIILAIWLAVIPASWAIIEYLGPQWLAIAVLLYSLWQASRAALKLFWRAEPSRAEKEKSERERKMAHYFYHCERNPKGFARLRVENFECETIEHTVREAETLRKNASE